MAPRVWCFRIPKAPSGPPARPENPITAHNAGMVSPSYLRAGLTALALGIALAATAAPLPDMPDTLIEKSRLVRESRDRVWDPASGQLGNLRQVRIVAEGCTVGSPRFQCNK